MDQGLGLRHSLSIPPGDYVFVSLGLCWVISLCNPRVFKSSDYLAGLDVMASGCAQVARVSSLASCIGAERCQRALPHAPGWPAGDG